MRHSNDIARTIHYFCRPLNQKVMKRGMLLFVVILLTVSLFSQEEKNKLKIKVSGFVNYNMFYDSRENVAAVDGLFLFYPKNEMIENGVDIYDNPSLTMLSMASRIGVSFFGAEVLGAKLGGKIEADFTLVSGATTMRFRHAYVKLDWDKTSLLAGQTWHPLFATDCFPTTLGIATGAPFQPFSRTPQIRLTHKAGQFHFLGALISQMDYASSGPLGKSPQYMRNAVIPEFALQSEFVQNHFLIGVIGDVKTIKPRTTTVGTEGTYKATETLTTYSVKLFSKYKKDKLEAKFSAMYGQNMYDVLMNGGYGVSGYDSLTGAETYTPLSGIYTWANVIYGNQLKFGFFAGYYQNLGSSDPLLKDSMIWSRGADINVLLRLMPTVFYTVNNLRLGFEYELNQAQYGSVSYSDGLVNDVKSISGHRFMLDITYYF